MGKRMGSALLVSTTIVCLLEACSDSEGEPKTVDETSSGGNVDEPGGAPGSGAGDGMGLAGEGDNGQQSGGTSMDDDDGPGMGGAGAEASEIAWVSEPTFLGNDNPEAPLAGILRLETNAEAQVVVTVRGGEEQWELGWEDVTRLEEPIVGLKPDVTYELEVVVSSQVNQLVAGPLSWTTPQLPEDFPPLEVLTTNPDAMESGMTLFNIRTGFAANPAYLVVIDHEGNVRWYYEGVPAPDDHRRLPNGNFLFNAERVCWAQEMDILGNRVRSWKAARSPLDCNAPADAVPVAADSFHHEMGLLESGNLLTLSTASRAVEDFPSSVNDPDAPPADRILMGTVIVEFSPDGQVVKEISMLDLLDTHRIAYSAFERGGPMAGAYGDEDQRAVDWDHGNAVIYDPESDGYIVSLRNQDAVVKVDRESEELVWILGPHANWGVAFTDKLLEPSGDLTWQYHQHAVELTPLGLGLYDNGNFGASAFEDPLPNPFSRGVVFSIDESSMTVEQVWHYGERTGDDRFYAIAMGDADWQPSTGNVLLVSGQRPKQAAAYASIYEVDEQRNRLFELQIGSPVGTETFTVYRAQRIADLRQVQPSSAR